MSRLSKTAAQSHGAATHAMYAGLAVALLFATSLGCSNTDKPGTTGGGPDPTATGQVELPEPQPADDPDAVKAFEAIKSGAIKKNEFGNIVSLDLLASREYAEELPKLPGLLHLESLSMGGPDITDDVMGIVAKLPRLKALNLGDRSAVTDAGAENICGMANLEDVNLRRSDIRDDAIKHLAKLPKLKRLRLVQTNITDDALAHLAGCPNLELLDIQDCKAVGDPGIAHLAGLTKMRSLRIYGSNM